MPCFRHRKFAHEHRRKTNLTGDSDAQADGFEDLSKAIWPDPAPGSDLAVHQPRLRSVLTELLRRASNGSGSFPLADAALSPEECAAIPHWPEYLALEGSTLLLPRYAQQLREIRTFVEARLLSNATRLPDIEVARHLQEILPPQRMGGTGAGPNQVHFDNAQQRLAIAALVDAPVGVLTGGPGTGRPPQPPHSWPSVTASIPASPRTKSWSPHRQVVRPVASAKPSHNRQPA